MTAACQRRWQRKCLNCVARAAGTRCAPCYGPRMARTLSLAKTVPPIVVALALTACTADRDRFPSLERRPAERAFGVAQPVAPAPRTDIAAPAPSDASLPARIAALREQARKAATLFDSRLPAAQRLASAARGAAIGSEAWSVAQVALADLDSARSQGMVAMADLDRLLIAAAQKEAEGDPSDIAAVKAAQSGVNDTLAGQDATIEALRSRLAS